VTSQAVRVPKDSRFESERIALPLCHCCEDCGHFDERAKACAHEWPTAEHRLADYQDPSRLPAVNFCKEFELR
jgi:hypothetical protein